MVKRLKRSADDLRIHNLGVPGLKVSDFESTASAATTTNSSGRRTHSARSLDKLDHNATPDDNVNIIDGGNYFCIGGSSICTSQSTPCLARELRQLDVPSREQVLQDVYGLTETLVEVHSDLLNDLDQTVEDLLNKHRTDGELVPNSDMAAYLLACDMDAAYVHNDVFRVKFLRAAQGNCKQAAKRLTRHFHTKLRLFGQDLLVKDITLDDLDEDDMEALRSGGFQCLPDRDLQGRSVLFGRYTAMRYKTINNMLRALWYIWMTILEDPVNQIKGVVALGYEVGKVPLERFDKQGMDGEWGDVPLGLDLDDGIGGGDLTMTLDGGFDRDLARQIVSIPLSVPARPVGYHLCTDSHQWVGILQIVMSTLCKFIRLRMRIHHGSDQENKYALLTHGLPVNCIPVDGATGEVDLQQHFDWIEQRRILEASRRAF